MQPGTKTETPEELVETPERIGTKIERGFKYFLLALMLLMVAALHLPDFPPDQVVAQSPAPNANTMTSPKVSLLVSAPADDESYVMPNFVGAHLADASHAISEVGLRIGKIEGLDSTAPDARPSSNLIIARQSPAPGARVSPGMTVTLEIAH